MNNRQRLNATMHYLARDRAPILDFNFWDETIMLWREQGLPAHVTNSNAWEFFGMDFDLGATGTGVEVLLAPPFEELVLEDRGEFQVAQQNDGVRVLRKKFMSSIPQHQGHLLVDRGSWVKHYKPRLDPAYPGRYPADWDERVKVWCDPNRPDPVFLYAGGLYGQIRSWMGMENLSYAVYDDPAWFDEMVTTVADCAIGALTRVLETGGQFDGCSFWEDMCYNAGPLLSPKHFRQYLQPHYRRITDLLHQHGVDVVWVDCDGKIDALLPLWLEVGVNCMFPVEVGVWGTDPVRYRQQYGRDLLMMGGFDKHILARSRREIELEIHRLAPLVADGGFIGFCDHRVPPDVPLENYVFYCETVRQVW